MFRLPMVAQYDEKKRCFDDGCPKQPAQRDEVKNKKLRNTLSLYNQYLRGLIILIREGYFFERQGKRKTEL